MSADTDDRRSAARRTDDNWRLWLPLVLSMLTTLFSIGALYGRLGGWMELVNFRLNAIEKVLKIGQ